MNVLGVDYGTKRIGLAWADDAMGFVLPYGVLVDSHTTKEEQLRALIKEERINKVVVGLPIGLDGEDKVRTLATRMFVHDLEEHLSIPVTVYDERFSSKQADNMGGDASRDEKAAMVILQSYISSPNT